MASCSTLFCGLVAAGLTGLYRGAHVNMLKIAVASAVQLAVFDGVKARLLRPPTQQAQQTQQVGDRRAGWVGAAAACLPSVRLTLANKTAAYRTLLLAAAARRHGRLAAGAPRRCHAAGCHGGGAGRDSCCAAGGCCDHAALEPARCGSQQAAVQAPRCTRHTLLQACMPSSPSSAVPGHPSRCVPVAAPCILPSLQSSTAWARCTAAPGTAQ